MLVNDILNLNKYKMRSRDKYVIVLKSGDRCFTLGTYRLIDWQDGRLPLELYCYTCKCLNEPCDIIIQDKIDFKLYKLYINNVDLHNEIYKMEDNDYNRRLK